MQNTLTNNTVIICINWICSGWGDSFVKTMLETGQEGDIANAIFDRVGTPIDAEAASKAIMSILQGRVFKHPAFPISLLHFGNKGVCSWYEFAKKTIELVEYYENLKNLEQQNKEDKIIEKKETKKFIKKPYRKKKFFKKVK